VKNLMQKIIQKAWTWLSAHRFEFLLLCLYSLAVIVLTFPLILKMSTSIYGHPGDASAAIWYFWWRKFAFLNGLSPENIKFIGAPFGVDWSNIPQLPGMTYPGLLLSLLTNEIFANNLLVLLSFPIAGMTMYYLVKHITGDKKASAIAGLIYGFCPYHLAHSLGHLGIAMSMQWLPLLVLTLLRLRKRRTIGSAVAFGAAFALVTLTNYYDALFMAVFVLCFSLFMVIQQLVTDREKWFKKLIRPISLLALGLTVSVLIVAPFALRVVKTASSAPATYSRGIDELNVWSARPWDYILPPPDNPVFGKLVSPFVLSHLHSSNVSEQTLYLGFVTMALAFTGFFVYFVRGKRYNRRTDLYYLAGFFSVMAVVAFVASGPAFKDIWGHRIPLFSSFVYKILPMFRVYARFGIVVMLCVTVLAGLGLSYILGRIKKKETKLILLVGLTVLVAVEFANSPPPPITDYSKTPAVYTWLKQQPGDFIIAEYPLNQPIYKEYSDYVFYQRLHQKRLFNGSSLETKGEAYRALAADVSDSQSASVLEHLGVKYAIVHLDKYSADKPSYIGKGFHLVRKFGEDTAVYSIRAPHLDTMILPISGFSAAEEWPDGRTWRWIGDNATISLVNSTQQTHEITLRAGVMSFSGPRTLSVVQNGKTIYVVHVPVESKDIKIENIKLLPGDNNLKLKVNPGAESIDSVLHNNDYRVVSIALGDIRLE
jgi:hypothetical protein